MRAGASKRAGDHNRIDPLARVFARLKDLAPDLACRCCCLLRDLEHLTRHPGAHNPAVRARSGVRELKTGLTAGGGARGYPCSGSGTAGRRRSFQTAGLMLF